MKRWQKALLNAVFVSGISLFSVFSAELSINGYISWLSVQAGLVAFGLSFFTLLARLTDDDDNRIKPENGGNPGNPGNPQPTVASSPPRKKNRILSAIQKEKKPSNGKILELIF